MYKHQDANERFVSLHDCKATIAKLKDDALTFYFPNGIWILKDHPANNLDDLVKTDVAEVTFHILGGSDELDFFVYKRKDSKRDIRKRWPIEKLVRKINRDGVELEFLYQYRDGYGRIIEGYLHKDEKPYFMECELRLRTDNVVYFWNDVYPDATW